MTCWSRVTSWRPSGEKIMPRLVGAFGSRKNAFPAGGIDHMDLGANRQGHTPAVGSESLGPDAALASIEHRSGFQTGGRVAA